jgi:hypothetical protein
MLYTDSQDMLVLSSAVQMTVPALEIMDTTS